MIIETIDRAPYIMRTDGMVEIPNSEYQVKPGKVLSLWLELRKRVGSIVAVQKPGMKFKTRSNDATVDKIRPIANELGLLIYPTESSGEGFPVEDGTLASTNLVIIVQAVEDGSAIKIAGFGLGADSQDKAGGKAGTYAFKAALIQSLLAAGSEDTDDSDSPIKGGVRKKTNKPTPPSLELVKELLEKSNTADEYIAARELLRKMSTEDMAKLIPTAKVAKERCGVQ